MQLIEEFHHWLAADGKMAKTLESYTGDLRTFLAWKRERNRSEEKLSRKDILDYKQYLLNTGYAVNTINKKINSLRSYNQFLLEREELDEMIVHPEKDRVKIANGSGNNVDVFDESEIESILSYVREETSQRNQMIVHLLLYTGIRVTELVNIKLNDLDLMAGELKVVGKGGKYREIPLNAKVKQSIRNYLSTERKENKHSNSDYLILTQRSPQAHRDTINYMLNGIAEELGIEIYPHKFRHTTFTRLVKKGADIATVSELAGHSSIETTHEYYLKTTKEEKLQAVELL